MRWVWWLALGLIVGALPANAADARIIKVLPHLLDDRGPNSVSAGLFEREAYQKQLRNNPQRISGLRVDVQWKAPGVGTDRLKLRLQLRTAKREPQQLLTIEAGVNDHRRWGS